MSKENIAYSQGTYIQFIVKAKPMCKRTRNTKVNFYVKLCSKGQNSCSRKGNHSIILSWEKSNNILNMSILQNKVKVKS